MKSEVFRNIIENVKRDNESNSELAKVINYVLSSSQFKIFDEIMKDVKEEYFVKDAIHGISHNERVAFLATAIGIHEGLSENEMKVLVNAALYHDIGRASAKGKEHGVESARIIANNRNELAKGLDDKEVALLEFLCSIHSNPDEEMGNLAKKYNVEINIAKKIMNVLKDADALDRVRLPRYGKINTELLRLDYSKSLVQTSKELLHSYRSIQYDLGIDFNTSFFEPGNFNIIEDDENFYIFRALNDDNATDLDDPDIDVIRSKRHIAEDNGTVTKYNRESKISLEEVYNAVRVARTGKNNNCVSFSSNSNVTLDYASERYAMYAIPKKGDESSLVAGKYMLEEISKKISSRLKKEKIDKSVIDILNQIDAETSASGVKELVAESFELKKVNTEQNKHFTGRKGTLDSKESVISRFEGKQFLNSAQELEYSKIIAKLTVLEVNGILNSILSSQLTNTRLIGAVGSAFSSGEFIHYGDISKDKITEISKESVELFSIIQQMQEQDGIDSNAVELLKSKVLDNIKENSKLKMMLNTQNMVI